MFHRLYLHIFFKLQFMHSGFLLLQTYLPKSTSWEFTLFHSSFLKYFLSFFSVTNMSSFSFVILSLLDTLNTCVSTAKEGSLNKWAKTPLAVFLPTPGRLSKKVLSFGT